jgi:hypothetical protein
MNETLSKINLPYVCINYTEPIVYFEYKEGAELGFPEIRKLISCAEELSNQKPYVTFADARVSMNITNEGKRILSDVKNMPLFRGTAALVNNNLYKYAANLLSLFDSPKYPFRAFTSKEEAIKWLSSLPLDSQ